MLGSYFVFVALIIAGFGMCWVLFSIMRKVAGRKQDLLGQLLIGPLHSYLKGRGYSLKRRELLGWFFVFLLMLAAPLITWFLEH